MFTAEEARSSLVPWGIAYVHLDVGDVAAATEFWTTYGGLCVNQVADDVVYLRGGCTHHWVALRQAAGEPGVRTLGFEVRHRKDLDEFEKRLSAAGVESERSIQRPWAGETLAFDDPTGYRVELVADMGYVPVPPPPRWFAPSDFLHAVIVVEDPGKSYQFYTDVLGFRESDRVLGGAVFLRGGNGWHHSLVLVSNRGRPHLDHLCFQMADFDQLMRARAFMLDRGLTLRRDLVRHPTSGSIGFYAQALPEPTMLELCVGHAVIDDPDHRPRALVPHKWAGNVWLPPDE